MDLFDDDDEEQAGEAGPLKVNAAYAARFEKRKKKQEIARLREQYGDSEEEDEEDEDEDGELLTPALDLQIMRTIDSIRNRRPEVYARDTRFFERDQEDAGGYEAGVQDRARREPLRVRRRQRVRPLQPKLRVRRRQRMRPLQPKLRARRRQGPKA